MRITSKGQVTIPIEIREELGLLPGTEVEVVRRGDSVRIVKAGVSGGRRSGREAVERLCGSGDGRMTTDEILALMRRP